MDSMKISEIEAIANFAYLNPEKANMATAIRQLLAERREMLREIVESHRYVDTLKDASWQDCGGCKYCTEAREMQQEAADGK